mmetsp:Transcript_43327/g.65474  ORF Transcript_43327/g.65474 Transcript_43327/m.65474 type:complete len:189 (-) Transcript_43327:582-1148(-)
MPWSGADEDGYLGHPVIIAGRQVDSWKLAGERRLRDNLLLRAGFHLSINGAKQKSYECIVSVYPHAVDKSNGLEGNLAANIYVPVLSQSCEIIIPEDGRISTLRNIKKNRKPDGNLDDLGDNERFKVALSNVIKNIKLNIVECGEDKGVRKNGLQKLHATLGDHPSKPWKNAYARLDERNKVPNALVS